MRTEEVWFRYDYAVRKPDGTIERANDAPSAVRQADVINDLLVHVNAPPNTPVAVAVRRRVDVRKIEQKGPWFDVR